MSVLDTHRKQKDDFMRRDPQSPLDDEARKDFAGLRYYPENPALRLTVRIEEFDDQDEVQMQTSTGEVRKYLKWGRFAFEVDGRPAQLVAYGDPQEGFFVPFTDATSGQETYGAGRYIEPEPLGDGRYLVDFNLAYNPWCAYSPYYSCPIPPADNRLKVPIRAGELDFHPAES